MPSHPQTADLELPLDFELSADFQACFKALEESRKNVYITGEAGTGKSTFLKYFRIHSAKKAVVLAPTGIAAIHVGGQTVHSFFRLPHQFIQSHHIRRIPNGERMFGGLELLIIDEVSMMRADLMDAVDHSLRLNTNRMSEPFGGVQVMLLGDLFQLPPIIDRDLAPHFSGIYETPYFFSAKVFQQSHFYHHHFQKIYRQSDDRFAKLLNQIRHKKVTAADLEVLNRRAQNDHGRDESITLTTTNAQANTINETHLNSLEGPDYEYCAEISGAFDEQSFPTETKLRLRVGARVLMIRNDPEKRWVNGSLGEVAKLERDAVFVKIKDEVYEVEPVLWEKVKYSFNEMEGNISHEVIGSFEQYPMKLAWAITIHKSQGLTFERATVDLGRGAFAHGQAYVALSRCRSLEGLYLKRPVRMSDMIFDAKIKLFDDCFTPLFDKTESCHQDAEHSAGGDDVVILPIEE